MALKIPRLGKRSKGLFKTGIDSVRTWVDNLPLMNTEATVSQLEFALDEINRADIPLTERMAAIELLNAPVMHATGALRKCFLGKPFPLRQVDLARSGKATGLCQRMASAYRIVVPALERKADAKPVLATAIHRAIRHLSELLIGNYQIYVQYPEGVWKDLHSLYASAGQHRLLQLPVPDITLRHPESTSIEDIYKQILLLSLACPYRLRQREISDVYVILHQWAPFSKLYKASDPDSSGFFACDLKSDNPPVYLQQGNRDRLDESWRIFDTADMEEPVRNALESRRNAPKHYLEHLEDRILQRLMMSWGVMPERQFTRRQGHATVRMVLGLNAIHRILSKPSVQEHNEDHTVSEIIRDREYLQDPTFEQPTRINLNPPTDAAGTGSNAPGQPAGYGNLLRGAYAPGAHIHGNKRDSLHIEHWKMRDMSTGGYCLLWDSDEPSCAQVGELVAICTEENGAEDWHLGVIRWMRFTAQQGLGLGIQMMSPGASAIWASICSDRIGAENRMQGILLQDRRGAGEETTLLLPPLPFRTGSLSRLVHEGNEQQIRLTRQLEDTGSFAQFQFTPAGEP